jgi:hypothetical protein
MTAALKTGKDQDAEENQIASCKLQKTKVKSNPKNELKVEIRPLSDFSLLCFSVRESEVQFEEKNEEAHRHA